MNPEQKRENIEEPQETQEVKEVTKNEIVSYTDEYKAGVIKFFTEMAEEEGHKGGLPGEPVPEYFRKDDKSNFWVALDKQADVIGTIGLENCGNDIGYLKGFFVKKELRNRRVGGKLVKTLVEFARENGYEKLFLATSPNNIKAQKMYEKRGMKRIDNPPSDQVTPRLSQSTPPEGFTFPEGAVFFEMDLEEEK